ncbi:rhodanese-related sulfurtransferase [Stappia stellulata]|uniref:oxygen-dependent tRNA uridine(34) hydroxylase TrhO n=1 Tax=Stappia stellulata TaxID=71235 RepID=UPI0009FEFBDB|nr:rhodanese-related sulfurtransferase [Stappia stellulata]
MSDFRVSAFYHFAALDDFAALKAPIAALACGAGVRGSVLLAAEGVNGTIAGTDEGVEAVLSHLRADPRLAGLQDKSSRAERMPFKRLKVRLKREIVSLGVDGIDPVEKVGTYVAPEDWNALLQDPDVVLVDTRNDYEIAFGTFEGAVSPETRSFRSFPEWVKTAPAMANKPRVAMFCTGGIRCEKATSLLLEEGFGEVYHLDGGILNYLERVPREESLWRGDCFVFDERIAVDHDLTPTWGEGAPEDAHEVLPRAVIEGGKG